MSTKEEKVRAQQLVERFLVDLVATTPRVPKSVREEAKKRLKHLATASEVERGVR